VPHHEYQQQTFLLRRRLMQFQTLPALTFLPAFLQSEFQSHLTQQNVSQQLCQDLFHRP
jgi:hypothetical protein